MVVFTKMFTRVSKMGVSEVGMSVYPDYSQIWMNLTHSSDGSSSNRVISSDG